MTAPAAIAFWLGEAAAFKAFLQTIVFFIISSAAFYIYTYKSSSDYLRTRDSFVFVTFSWILASLIGALPFYLSGAIASLADAYFETMSGFTTTGATILTDIEKLPASLLFWRSLTNWLGGMGIVVLAVAILPFLGVGGLQLIEAEVPGLSVDKIAPRIAQTAKILWLIYLGLTLGSVFFLKLGGMSMFDSLVHTFATMATGGFSVKNASIAHYNSAYIDTVITVFMILGGINFSLLYKLICGRTFSAFKDTELCVYTAIFFASTIIVALSLYGGVYDSFAKCLRYSSFQVAAILTTTGYVTADYEKWPYAAQSVLFFLMFVGGCSGSTSGGIKVIRLVTLLKQAVGEMKSLIHPRGVFALKIGSSVVKSGVANAVAGFFFLYIMTVLTTAFVVATADHDMHTSFSTALSTVGNIGPGFGLIGPVENYSFFQDYIKWFLSFAMLAGRLELYTVMVIFTPYFWRK